MVEFIPPKKETYDLKLNAVIEKLKTAKRPLIIAGHGIRLSGSVEIFYKFIEKFKIPVVSTFNGFDYMLDNNPYSIGRIGTIGQRAGNFALQNADLILSLGTRNNIRQVSYNYENFGKNAFKISVDIDNAELNKPLAKMDLKINADLNVFLNELLNSSFTLDTALWLENCQNLKEKYSFKNYPEHIQKEKINPYFFVESLTKKLSKGDTLVSANATPSICIFQIGHNNGQRIIMNSGDASMGYGLPCGIGSYFETKGKTVVVEGDGSIMMNIQELQTISSNHIPIKIFVINNNGYSSIRQTQKNFFNGRMTGSGETSGVFVPEFTKIAQAFNIQSVKLDKIEDIEKKIDFVLSSNEPMLCEVMVEENYIFAPKLSSKKLDDGTMVSPSLEDMFPFLPREEFEQNMLK